MQKISETDLILNPDGSVYHLGLLPEHIADRIIGVGDPDRVEQITRHFSSIEFKCNKREFITHTGMFAGKRITVISTGIGPDNVEIFFTELDALVNMDLEQRIPRPARKSLSIVRLGTSGSVKKEIGVDTHLVSDYAVGLDNLMNFYNLPADSLESKVSAELQAHTSLSFKPYVVRGAADLREQVGHGMIAGNTVSAPGFYAPQGRQVRLDIKFPNLLNDVNSFQSGSFQLSNFEMETASYFAFARLLGHRAASVNAILANRITNEFSDNPAAVVDSLIQKVLERI